MDATLRLILPGPVGLYGLLLAALSVTEWSVSMDFRQKFT
jgi:hypothetical protein